MLTALWENGIPQIQWGLAILASLVAVFYDVRHRIIPNWLTLPMWVGGLAWSALSAGGLALGDALLASVILAAPYVWLYVVAGGGAGDAKMMGALGAWMGMVNGLVLLMAVSLSAIVIGVLISLHRRRVKEVASNLSAATQNLLWSPLNFLTHRPIEQVSSGSSRQKMPYGIVISTGSFIGAVGILLWRI